MSKRIPILVVSLCFLWLLYQSRELIQLLIYAVTTTGSSSEEVAFPLGENAKITIDLPRSYIKKPYAISLRTEFVDGEKRGGRSEMYKQLNYPYNFTVKCYKIYGNRKNCFLRSISRKKEKLFKAMVPVPLSLKILLFPL